MTNIWYSRLICLWLGLGSLVFDSYLLYIWLSAPFQWVFVFLAWLILGINIVVFFGLSVLWNIDIWE